MWKKLSRAEKAVLAIGIVAWSLFGFFAAPQFGGVDVYLFRDAALNLLHGNGFATASFEHSHSFHPLLYSSYTPLSQWVFLPFGLLSHGGQAAANLYYFLLALGAAAVVLWLLMQRMAVGRMRLLAVVLVAITFPASYVGAENDRPEPVAFFLLLLLLYCLQKANTTVRAVACGIVGGLCFLAEPIAGVLACLLIGGALLLPALEGGKASLRRASVLTVLAALAFLAPIAVTVAEFQHQDPMSVARFIHQAKVGGLMRTPGRVGDLNLPAGAAGAPETTSPQQKPGKYTEALRFQWSLGAMVIGLELAAFLVGLLWVVLCVTGKGPAAARVALISAGFILFPLVFAMFPLQFNYLVLTRSLFPFVLFLDWAGCRKALRREWTIEAIVILNLVVLLPGVAIMTLQRTEGRASYVQATEEARFLKGYLAQHGKENGVVLVPSGQYYIYEGQFREIFNPDYLSSQHDMNEIVAIANCNTSTRYLHGGERPLPLGVDPSRFSLIAPGGDAVVVGLLGHKLMASNWSWSCDLYASRDPQSK
jgi:hypothetical protein